MACSLCSCGASHRRFSAASVREPCWGGEQRQRSEPRAGQAAAPRLKHRSASGTPAHARGSGVPGRVRWGKRCQPVLGKARHLKGLCLSWAAFARLRWRKHSPFCLLLSAVWCSGPCTGSGVREMGKASPAALPAAASLVLLPRVGCCLLSRPGWRVVPGDRLLCKRATQLAG